jgi:hypothetical protein
VREWRNKRRKKKGSARMGNSEIEIWYRHPEPPPQNPEVEREDLPLGDKEWQVMKIVMNRAAH